MNCETCINNYYKINGTNNCYSEDLLEQGYYLKNNLFFPCEENCLTCSNSKTKINDIESNNCLSCDKINKGLYLVNELNNCESIDYKNNGYYLKEDSNGIEIFYKCYQSCSLCDKGKEFDIDTNQDNHNCLECSENNYKLKNDLNPKNCYGNEMISLGYFLVDNYWQLCHENCESCIDKPIYNENNELVNQNCIVCYEGLHFIDQTNNCANNSILENGYYFDDIDLKYHKCNIQCKTCQKISDENNPNCLSCNINQGYYPADNKPSSNCYNKTTINNGYSLLKLYDKEKGIISKKWVICYSTCNSCFSYGNSIIHNCHTCISKYYLLYNTTNCVSKEYALINGYYFNSTFSQFVKCDKACITCNLGPIGDNTNCIKCNEEEGYYSIFGKSNSMCFNSEAIKEGYFLDKSKTPYKWNECYENCATCEFKGNSKKMSCLSCKTNLKSKLYNKTIYFRFSNGNCIEGCPNNLFLTKDGDCVQFCPNNTYKFIQNYTCIDSCPQNYEINVDKKECEFIYLKNQFHLLNLKN